MRTSFKPFKHPCSDQAHKANTIQRLAYRDKLQVEGVAKVTHTHLLTRTLAHTHTHTNKLKGLSLHPHENVLSFDSSDCREHELLCLALTVSQNNSESRGQSV